MPHLLHVTIAGLVTTVIALTFTFPATVTVDEQRGVALPTWELNGYEGAATTQAVTAITSVGANWIQIVPTWHMATQTSNNIDGSWSVTDADVLSVIDLAHSQGLKVFLKPHVDPSDGTNRWQINPSDRAAWYSSYRAFITHYAAIAQAHSVEQFSVGCELKTMTTSADRSQWLTVINAVKAQYRGPLVYAANSDEYTNVSFWDQLNFIGVDAYFPLSTTPTKDVATLEAAWAPIRDDLAKFAASTRRPILFTEAGYPSQVGATVEPWNNSQSTTPAQDEQAAAYQALLATFSGQPWWAGVFWWSWWTDTGVFDSLDYPVQGKPAESLLRNWWASTGSSH